MHNMLMKMPNMRNSFVFFRHSLVPEVGPKMVGVNCGLIPDRPSEPASLSGWLSRYTNLGYLQSIPEETRTISVWVIT